MIVIRPRDQRGATRLDWLDSRHTFSFGHYRDAEHMGFSSLRVINDDTVVAGGGFATHGHRDMEIVSYVLSGALAHRDSLGTGSVIRPGEVQRMSAGTGITHSEFNASESEPVHFLQIWFLPEKNDLTPSYEQRAFVHAERHNRLRLVGDRHGSGGAVTIHQDVRMYAATLDAAASVEHAMAEGRQAWLHVAYGAVTVNGHALEDGDGAAFTDERRIEIAAGTGAEVLLFDLA